MSVTVGRDGVGRLGDVTTSGRVVSVNVGRPRVVEWHGRAVESGIWKEPVTGRVAVRGVNVEGDGQADRRVHGGRDKAVYAYALEDYAWWAERLGRDLEPGTFGENLTVEGVDLGAVVIGTRWNVADVVLEVSEPRLPCFKLGMRMGDAGFVDEFERAERFGTYLRIVAEGTLGAGDAIDVDERDRPGITIHELGTAYRHPSRQFLERLLAEPVIGDSWHEWARRRLDRIRARP